MALKGIHRWTLFDHALALLLIVLVFIIAYPFYNSIVLSFNDGRDALNAPIYFWPREFTLNNYLKVLENRQFLIAAFNTVARTLLSTLGALALTSMFAYGVSHKELHFRTFYIVVGMITMYFSGGLIPTFLVYRDLGLYDNFLVYVLPSLFSMYNAVIFLSFFRGIPRELEECACIDGANELYSFFKIIVPVSTPVFATIALFVGVGQWNAWFDCMIYTQNENLEVLSHIFAKMVMSQRYLETMDIGNLSADSIEAYMNLKGETSTSLQLASMAITTFPIIVLYPFLQKYFVKGIMIGSVKG